MRSIILFGFLLVIFVCCAIAIGAENQDQQGTAKSTELPGRTAFLNNKCNLCHSIESEKVEKTSGGYQKSTDKNVPPDLSGIGRKVKADWIVKYLKKTEALDGVKHARLYRGTEKELEALAKWLEELK